MQGHGRSGVLSLLMGLSLLLASAAAAAPPRNVLLLIADDLGLEASNLYPASERLATTPPPAPMPHLRALAERGVLFSQTWATPWCSPTRAAILTGRHGFRTGMGRAHGAGMPPLPLDEVTLPELFRQHAPADYVLANLGKWHLSSGADDPSRYGWPYYAGGHPDLGKLDSYSSWPKTINGVTRTSTVYPTTDTVNETLGRIRKAKAEGRRYFVWGAFNAAHGPYHKPPNALHSRDGLPASGGSRRAYYEAMIEALDTEIGRLLREVDLASTTVIFVGDNGTPPEVIASPYSRNHAKATNYESGVRVPLLIAGAGVASPGRIVRELVSTVDLFPTILELAGIDPAAAVPRTRPIDGISLLPHLASQAAPAHHGFLYTEQFMRTYQDRYHRAVRNDTFKLIRRFDGSREFYNLVRDPLEKSNLLAGTLSTTQRRNLTTLSGQMDRLLATR